MTLFAALAVAGCSKEYTVVKAHEQAGGASVPATLPDGQSGDEGLSQDLKDGLILYRQGQNARAIDLFEKAIMADNTNWLGHYYLGLALTKETAYQGALRQFRASLKFAADNRSRSMVYVAMGETWEAQGELGRAKQNYHTALNLHPESSGAQSGLKRLAEVSQLTR
jgi:tetratricopeptide (TPR) repeat protein